MSPAPLRPGWGCLLPGTVPGRAQVFAGGPVIQKLPHRPYGRAGGRTPGPGHLRAAPAPSTNTAVNFATHFYKRYTACAHLHHQRDAAARQALGEVTACRESFAELSTRSKAHLLYQHVWCLGSHGLCCSTAAGHLLPWGGLRCRRCLCRGRRSRQNTVLQFRQQPWACTACVGFDAQATFSKAMS